MRFRTLELGFPDMRLFRVIHLEGSAVDSPTPHIVGAED